MNYFIDTEFTCLPWDNDPELISIAVVDENDREYFACLNDFSAESVSPFVKENVLSYLPDVSERKKREVVSNEIHRFLSYNHPTRIWCLFPTASELIEWGFKASEIDSVMERYGDIDLRFLKELLGFRYSTEWPERGSDLVPLVDYLKEKGDLPDNEEIHNALADARWNKKVWERHKKYKTKNS